MIFRRRAPLPDWLTPAWRAFLDCAEVIEGGRRRLLETLPTGRVEPGPVGLGLDALADALEDARQWMDRWRVTDETAGDEGLDELEAAWDECATALDEAGRALPEARAAAATPGELEDLLGAVQEVVEPLDAFADAERVWRATWRVPARRDRAEVD